MTTEILAPGVYVREDPSGSRPIQGVGTAVAAFVGLTEHGPPPTDMDPAGVMPRLVTSWNQYQDLYGGFVKGAYLPDAVYGYFNNGGGTCYVVRVSPDGAPPAAAVASATVKAIGDDGVDTLRIEAVGDGRPRVEISHDPPAKEGEGPSSFTINVRDGDTTESHGELNFGRGQRNVENVVNSESNLIRVTALAAQVASIADRIPVAGTVELTAAEVQVVTGADQLTAQDFSGDERNRTGIRGLIIAEDVTMVAVPDLMTAARRPDGTVDLGLVAAVQADLIAYAEATHTMVILDAPPGLDHQEIGEWRRNAQHNSRYAALYYPWIEVNDPVGDGSSTTKLVPPSGHVAGVWARTDSARGVWKAPANEAVRGALNLERKIAPKEQAPINLEGVNVIRPFGTRGILVWGARTLTDDTNWQYVNVQRLFNYIEKSIELGTQWVVFEPNDADLWARVTRTVTTFLKGLWRQGALVGATPEQAFYVKCDEQNNPTDQVKLGYLTVEVGIAPVRPAEFVIFRIRQFDGGADEG